MTSDGVVSGPVAFSGCVGQCASSHNLYAMERPKEVWAGAQHLAA